MDPFPIPRNLQSILIFSIFIIFVNLNSVNALRSDLRTRVHRLFSHPKFHVPHLRSPGAINATELIATATSVHSFEALFENYQELFVSMNPKSQREARRMGQKIQQRLLKDFLHYQPGLLSSYQGNHTLHSVHWWLRSKGADLWSTEQLDFLAPDDEESLSIRVVFLNTTNLDEEKFVLYADVLLDILDLNFVKRIEADTTVWASEIQQPIGMDLWNLGTLSNPDHFEISSHYRSNYTGKNIRVHILDTGVNVAHDEFEGRASVYFVQPSITDHCKPGYDCNGHGTHVAGTVAGRIHGVAKQALILSSPVLRSNGNGTTAAIKRALERIFNSEENTGSLINMSLGGPPSQDILEILGRLSTKRIVCIVAAGNYNGDACRQSPADSTEAITVASYDRSGQKSSFSNYGDCVDIFAPGSDIRSASIPERDSYAILSGTSMATPIITGIAALMKEQNPQISSFHMKKLLQNNSKRTNVSDVPFGENRAAQVNFLTSPCLASSVDRTCITLDGRYKPTGERCVITGEVSRSPAPMTGCSSILYRSIPDRILRIYSPFIFNRLNKTSEVKAWLYETSSLEPRSAKLNLELAEVNPNVANNETDVPKIRNVTSRLKTYPQYVSLTVQPKSKLQVILLPRTRVIRGLILFTLILELPRHCADVKQERSTCSRRGNCIMETGICECSSGYSGDYCEQTEKQKQQSRQRQAFSLFYHNDTEWDLNDTALESFLLLLCQSVLFIQFLVVIRRLKRRSIIDVSESHGS